MHHIKGNDRDQIRMMSLGEMLDPDAFVRIIDAFVDMLDLEAFEFKFYKLNKEGQPPYHPSVLLKIYF